MNAVLVIVSVCVGYLALSATMDWIGVVGFILRLRPQVFSSNRYNLLYTMDCVLLALADDVDATMVTFDGELLDHGGVAPGELIE
jgi:hypothetical protein